MVYDWNDDMSSEMNICISLQPSFSNEFHKNNQNLLSS